MKRLQILRIEFRKGGGQAMVEDRGNKKAMEAFDRLLSILIRLRAPGGCPWDRKQTDKTMAPRILEEAYEVADAIEEGRDGKVAEELGDLSMNLLMTCLIGEERGAFDVESVFNKIARKLIHRHPHVFKTGEEIGVTRVLAQWEDLKRVERRENGEDSSVVAGIPKAMPALLRSFRFIEKVRCTGADLPFLRRPKKDVQQQLETLLATEGGKNLLDREASVGALLFSLVVLLTGLGINPEMALRAYLEAVERSFRNLETKVQDRLAEASSEEIDRNWDGKAVQGD